MTELDQMTEFRDYVAPPDQAALDRAHRAIRVASRATPAPKHRHRARRAGLVLAGGLVATCALALLPGRSGGPARSPDHTLLGTGTANAATISARARAALRAADGILLETTTDRFVRSGQVLASKQWTDLRESNASRTIEDRRGAHIPGSDFSVSDLGMVPTSAHDVLQRNVTDGRCAELLLTGMAAGAPAPSSGRELVSAVRLMSRRARVSVEIRQGVRLLHLSENDSDPDLHDRERVDLWIDAATYLPVRSVSTAGDPAAPAGSPNEEQVMTSTYKVLDRPSDVASTMLPPVPAGQTCTRSTRNIARTPSKRAG